MEEKIITFEAEKVKLSSGFLKDFVVCTAYLMSDGINRNDSEFTLESLQKSLPGFLDKPVLANIWYKRKGGEKEAYVGSHDWEVTKDENGEEYISYRNGERPVGVIPGESSVSIQKYKGRNFVVAKLYLWKQYNYELLKILAKDKKKKVSVEVRYTDTEKYTYEGRSITKVNAFDFLGVTILGHKKTLFGEPQEIEEGIEGSHLELDKDQLSEYVMTYERALSKALMPNEVKNYDSLEKEFETDVSYSIADKREIALSELIDAKGEDVVLISISSDESSNEIEGRYFLKDEIYSFKAIINIDGSCEIYQEEKLEEKEIDSFIKYLKITQTGKSLDIKEVNLVDAQKYDIGQLIYKIFTYHNFKDIVDYIFIEKDEDWEVNPVKGLRKPIAILDENKIIYSEESLRGLDKEELKGLYQRIDTIPCFQLVTDIVKSIMAEKYEMGETSKVENEDEKVISEEAEVINNEEECKTLEENDCNGQEPIENGCDTPIDGETLEENTEDTENKPVDEEEPNENPEESEAKSEEECKNFDEDEEDKDEEPAEDFEQKYLAAINQIGDYTSQIEALSNEIAKLSAEKEEIGKELEEVREENAKMKDEAFAKMVEDELSLSALDEENKNRIRAQAKEHKFADLVEVQKEIAFVEKQTKTNSYTFGSKITAECSKKAESVFDRLKRNL